MPGSNIIVVRNIAEQTIEIKNDTQTQSIEVSNDVPIIVGGEPYNGETEWTPSEVEQTIPVAGYYSAENIIVKPIPSNYGKITYSGYELTVS